MRRPQNTTKMIPALLVLGLVFGLLYSTFCPSCAETNIVVDKFVDNNNKDLVLQAYVIASLGKTSLNEYKSEEELRNRIFSQISAEEKEREGQSVDYSEFKEGRMGLEKATEIVKGLVAIEKAKLDFYIVVGEDKIPVCSGKETGENGQKKEMKIPEGYKAASATGGAQQIIMVPYAECRIPYEKYKDTCITIEVDYPGEGDILEGKATISHCDDTVAALPLYGILSAESERYVGIAHGPCMIAFLIMGLLFASMYFSGKNPIMLLDITTPRLPGPKSIAASGMILSPYGYQRMAANVKRQLNVLENELLPSATGAVLTGGVIRTAKGPKRIQGLPANIRNRIENSGAHPVLKALAALRARRAMRRGRGINQREIDEILNMNIHDYNQLARIKELLNEIENLPEMTGEWEYALRALNHWMYVNEVAGTLGGITTLGERGPSTWIHKNIFGRFASAFRSPLWAGFFGTSLGTFTRGWKITKRFWKTMASEATRGAMNIATLGHAEEVIDRWRGAGGVRRRLADIMAFSSPRRLVVGTYFQVFDKAAEAYKDLRKAVTFDLFGDYILKVLDLLTNGRIRELELNIERHNYQYELALQRLGEMIESIENELKARKNINLEKFENEVRRILNTDATISQKMVMLEEAARTYLGVSIKGYKGRGIAIIFDRIESDAQNQVRIYGSDRENLAYAKAYEQLYHAISMLVEVQRNKGMNRFDDISEAYISLGRDPHSPEYGTDIFRLFGINSFLNSAISGNLTVPGEGLIANLKLAWLVFTNRIFSIKREELERVSLYQMEIEFMNSLLTREGRKTMRELNITDPHEMLNAFAYMAKRRGMKTPGIATHGGMMEKGAEVPTGLAPYEMAPLAEWWKTDMQHNWITDPRQSINYFVNGLFRSSQWEVFHPDIFRRAQEILGRYPNIRNEEERNLLYRLYVDHYFKIQTTNMLEERHPNAYGHMQETYRFLRGVTNAMMAYAFSRLSEQEKERLANMDDPNQVREELLQRAFTLVRDGQITLHDMLEGGVAWVSMHEGGLLPYGTTIRDFEKYIIEGGLEKKGTEGARELRNIILEQVPVGDFDEIHMGYVAYYDRMHRRWEMFEPEKIDVIRGLSNTPNLAQEFNELINRPDASDRNIWEGFMNELENAYRNGLVDEPTFLAITWRYAKTTEDWRTFWQRREVHIVPKHEVPHYSLLGIDLTHIVENSGLSIAFEAGRRTLNSILHGVERVMYATGEPLIRKQMSISYLTEALRQHGMLIEEMYKTGRWDNTVMNPEVIRSMETLSREINQYKHIWDWTIDRNPQKMSTAHDTKQYYSGFYHFGPAMPFPVSTHRGEFNRAEWAAVASTYWPLNIMWLMGLPITLGMRGLQMASWSYANKYDVHTYNPIEPYRRAPGSIWKGINAVLNPFNVFAPLSRFPQTIGRMISTTLLPSKFRDTSITRFLNRLGNIWERAARPLDRFVSGGTPLGERALGGLEYAFGLGANPEDILWAKKGVAYVARYGNVNPGVSYYGFTNRTYLEGCLADYLVYRHGLMVHRTAERSWLSMDKTLRRQANIITVKREVPAPMLLMERESELASYGILENPNTGFLNPLLFIWNNPLFVDLSGRALYYRGRNLIASTSESWRAGGANAALRRVGNAIREGIIRPLVGFVTLRPIRNLPRDIVTCPICGSSKPRFHPCPRCGR